jgi:uncharacterized protein YjeT (DUF2065 family)
MMRDLALACGLVFVVEGLLYALVPGQVKRMAKVLDTLGDDQLRVGGAAAIAAGVGLVWLIQSWMQ